MIGIFYGCTTRANEKLRKNLEKFFEKIEIEYVPLGMDICCGAPLFLSGYYNEFLKQAEEVKEHIHDFDLVITPCPHCFMMFYKEYAECGIKIRPKVMHITEYVKKLLDEGRIRFKTKLNKKVVYHDPCYLGRQGKGIYDEPRVVLDKAVRERVELCFSRENSTCCGAGGLVRAYLPKLCIEVAKEKIETQIRCLNVDVITSACPFCYQNFLEASEGTGIEVMDFLEIINMGLE